MTDVQPLRSISDFVAAPGDVDTAGSIDVTAIIVNYNTKALVRPCVEALRASAVSMSLQIVFVENASRDGSVALLQDEFADCEIIINDTNVGFGRANNQALALARGRYVLLLNTDAFVAHDSLHGTTKYLDDHPDCAVLGVRLVGRDGALQPSCRTFPTPWNEFLARTGLTRFFRRTRHIDDMTWDHASARECDWVPGCYYLVRKRVIDDLGLFDPRYFLYYEEVDHCRAVKAAGWKVVCWPDTTVVHIGGESAKSDNEITASGRQIDSLQIESSLLYHRKHHGRTGLWLTASLAVLGDILLALRHLLRNRTVSGLRAYWVHSLVTMVLARRTAWGTRPTR